MRWFYREEHAPSSLKICGAFFLVFGAGLMLLIILSFSGPGVLSAMREGGNYLSETHGDSKGSWSVSASKDNEEGTRVTITYRYGNKSGVLEGHWDGQKYIFSEREQSE